MKLTKGGRKAETCQPQRDGAASRQKSAQTNPVRCIASKNEEKREDDGKATHGEASVKRPNLAFAAKMWALVRDNAILRRKLVELEGENAMFREKYE